MSKENAKRFQDELNKNESLQKELEDYNSSSYEDLVSFAGEKGFIFTVDEFKEIQLVPKKGTKILSDDELAQVAGGGYYWPVKGCPYGYTKFVNWIFMDDFAGQECLNCENYFTVPSNGYSDAYQSCKLESGPMQWE
ncbi:MAG: Nif11-like leader peptide family RiPP precursor [Desulfotomaculaceae bacterium]|nr:Nif11-like leader peptide family RiPP precursor [Desulfotomaculaceae bacterium]